VVTSCSRGENREPKVSQRKNDGDATGQLKRDDCAIRTLQPNAVVIELPGDHSCHIESMDAFLDAFN
jgi:hypothetical protein